MRSLIVLVLGLLRCVVVVELLLTKALLQSEGEPRKVIAFGPFDGRLFFCYNVFNITK